MAKILVCHSDAGNGPLSAATALAEAISAVSHGETQVSIVDVLEETNRLGFMVTGLYNYLLSKSLAWNSVGLRIIYNSSLVKSGALLAESVGSMKRLLQREAPDAILFTNPWIIGYVLRAVRLYEGRRPKLISVVVDIGDDLPPGWLHQEIDLFVVASDEARADLARLGADPSKVKVLGMPIRTAFLDGRGDERGRPCLECGATTRILLMAGRSGSRNTYPILRGLLELDASFHVTVQCGRNPSLRGRVEELSARPRARGEKPQRHVETLGFVPNIGEYMQAADVVVTKPGALTVSEAITLKLPLILDVYPMVMGQELGNVRYVESHHLGLIAPTPDDVPRLVARFLEDEGLRNGLRENFMTAPRLGNTFEIAREILGCMGG